MDKKDVMINELNKRIEQLNQDQETIIRDNYFTKEINKNLGKKIEELENEIEKLEKNISYYQNEINNYENPDNKDSDFINQFTDELILKIIKGEDSPKLIEFIITSKKGTK